MSEEGDRSRERMPTWSQRSADFRAPEHGGLHGERELPVEGDRVVDFSANLNPLGPPVAVLEAARSGVREVSAYPEPYSRSLRDLYAEALGLGRGNVLFGRGSTELIFLAAALLRGGRVAVESPGFAEYRRAARSYGLDTVDVEVGVDPSIEDYREAVRGGVDGCFVCTPHNPSGRAPGDVRDLVEDFPDCLFVVDRAYAAFEPPDRSPELRGPKNVVELHSLTKSFCIPGLRVGYLTAPGEIVDALLDVKQPWTVSQVAESAAGACIGEEEFLDESRRFVESEREFLGNRIGDRFEVAPSDANFLLVEVGDASAAKEELLEDGLLVRDCSSFGLPEHVRISVRNRSDNERLVEALLRLQERR
ncbi:MAG: Histidinol-phosphate aminotransferase [Methanonatronarchaeales archaeon]|nr:Histidinol-phosphate aminotransferase [Methanonatronarchaeales archaeon]